MGQPTNLESLLWGQCCCNLLTKSNSCSDDPVILQGSFILESPQVLLISTVRSLDNLVIIKARIVVLQKLDISNFRGINTMMMQVKAISLLNLSSLRVILQQQVSLLLT